MGRQRGTPEGEDAYADETVTVAGWLKKKSSVAGGFHRRWCVLHSRYLSWFKKPPRSAEEFANAKQGSLNLWTVTEVTVDGADITISVSPSRRTGQNRALQLADAAVDRLARLASSVAPSALSSGSGVLPRAGDIVLRAEDADTAQRWVQSMYAGAFEGSAQRAFDGEGSSVTGLVPPGADPTLLLPDEDHGTGLRDQGLAVRRLRVTVSERPARALFETKRLFGARVALGRVPSDARVQVDLSRSGKYVGELSSAKIGEIPATRDGTIDVIMFEKGLAMDAVRVRLRRDAWYAIRHRLDAGVLGASVAGAFAFVVGSAKVFGMVPGVVLALALQVAMMALVVRFNKDVVVLEKVELISMKDARAAIAAQSAKMARFSRRRGSASKSGRRTSRSSRPRGDGKRSAALAEDNLDKDGDDDDEFGQEADDEDIGDGADMTPAEQQLLSALRARLQDTLDAHAAGGSPETHAEYHRYISEDFRLLRFLRARKLNLRKAEKLFRRCLAWRIEYQASTVHDRYSPPDWLMDYFGSEDIVERLRSGSDRLPWYFKDRDGRLAVFLRTGGLNHRKIFKKLGSDGEKLFEAGVYVFEMLQNDLDAHFEASGRRVNPQLVVVIDLEGFQMSHQIPVDQALGLARRYLSKILDAYPEVLGRVVVVNAPWLFYSLWNLFKPFFPQRILDKISIFGSGSKRQFQRTIDEVLPPDQVPVAYGGTYMLDGDIYAGRRVPCRGPYLEDAGASLLARS